MIPHGVEIFVSVEPVDMRLGFDRLAGLAEERVQRSARSGALFLFFGKRKTALKLIFFDGSGLCIFHKRLDRRSFRIPDALDDSGVLLLEERELDDLLEGIDVERGRPTTPPRKPTPRTH